MTKLSKPKTKFLNKIFIIFVMLLSLCSLTGVLIGEQKAFAYTEKVTSLSNLNFSANNNLSNVYSNPSGWQKGFSESTATSGAINLDYYNSSFYIDAEDVPSKISDSADDHVLMINSKSSSSTLPVSQYYTNSSSLTLKPYSTYKIVVWTRVLEGAQGSIYVTGLDKTLGFERIDYNDASEWTDYTFYISTGINQESIKTELWLGSKPNKTASGAVFFDNIEIFQVSNNEAPNFVTDNNSLVSEATTRVKHISLNQSSYPAISNANFESKDLTGWTKTSSQMKEGTYAEILNLSTSAESNARNITYLGTDLSQNNKNALVLYTNENVKSNFGLKSPEINLAMSNAVKVSVNVKVAGLDGGTAFVRFVENDVLNANGEKVEGITPVTKEISIASNQSNKFQNDYTTVSFYVKGRSLYATSFNIELCLGSASAETSGVVAFDNLTIENISNTEYTSVSTSSFVQAFELQTDSSSYGITNATFNTVQKSEKELTYPLIPSNWTHNSSEEGVGVFGVVNTYAPAYNEAKAQIGGFANPGNPEGFLSVDKDTNNILLIHNYEDGYQSATSSTFNVSANKYYKLSFDYKLVATTSKNELLNIYVQDENNNVLYAEENITANNVWNKYTIYVSTSSYSNELKLILSLGTSENQVAGIAYFDNVVMLEQSDLTKESYATIAETNNTLDFEEGNFNLIKDNGTNVFDALRYTGALEEGTNPENGSPIALGGIVDGNNDADEFEIENSPNSTSALKYMMMIQTHGTATYSLTAKDSLSLKTESYYKFSIDVKTKFGATANQEEEEYGAEFSLTNLEEKLTGIISPEWETYTIYVNCTADTTVSLRFALKSLNTNTAGMVYFDNFSYETIDADTFNLANLNNKDKDNFLFIGNTDAPEEEDNSTPADADYFWIVAPSLILAAALILALVSYVMKKVKVTKWEKKKVNEYDRESTVHRDVVRKEAETRRDAKVKELEKQIKELETHRTNLEQQHQDKLKEARTSRNKGVSKMAEKEFKQYAKVHTAIENKIANLNAEINNLNTPDALLSIQHRIAVEKAKQDRLNKEKTYQAKKTKNKSKR